MTSRKGKQGKQPTPPPFSSEVMAALGREVQSNFGQQNSAAVGLDRHSSHRPDQI